MKRIRRKMETMETMKKTMSGDDWWCFCFCVYGFVLPRRVAHHALSGHRWCTTGMIWRSVGNGNVVTRRIP
tara:strand:+ start:140 stop:352 length:213 start_codon:yes stop_codon:yes gene_type:complete